jgi:hypothetical protein
MMGMVNTPSAAPRRRLKTSPFADRVEEEVLALAVSDRVAHDKYGLGEVKAVGAGSVIVAFGSERVRVASPFSKLTRL